MQITITQPDDWHLHLRDGEALATVVPHSCATVRSRHRHAQSASSRDYRRPLPGSIGRAFVAAVPPGMQFRSR
jgi:hypothetical protein